MLVYSFLFLFFFFNDTATTEIYTLSLHDALPISYEWDFGDGRTAQGVSVDHVYEAKGTFTVHLVVMDNLGGTGRSEEHTSELQSRLHLVCRLLLEKKKKSNTKIRNRDKRQRRRAL